jgi:hypothetical protein
MWAQTSRRRQVLLWSAAVASNEITYLILSTIPADQNYNSGAISVRIRTQNYYYESDFDPSYTNIVYIEVPAGSMIPSALSNYYKNGFLPDIAGSGYDRYRYYRVVANNGTSGSGGSWSSWHGNGTPYYTFTQFYTTQFTPPAEMPNEVVFEFRIGLPENQRADQTNL